MLAWGRLARCPSPGDVYDGGVPVHCRQQNAEANAFAMALLMPEEWVRRDFESRKDCDAIMDHLVGELADKYGVTQARMAMRLVDLKLMSPTSMDP